MLNRILSVVASLGFVGFGLMGLVMGLFNGGIDWLPAIVGSIFTGVGVFSLLKGISGSAGKVANNELEGTSNNARFSLNPATKQ